MLNQTVPGEAFPRFAQLDEKDPPLAWMLAPDPYPFERFIRGHGSSSITPVHARQTVTPSAETVFLLSGCLRGFAILAEKELGGSGRRVS
jgi:hypothetical protein